MLINQSQNTNEEGKPPNPKKEENINKRKKFFLLFILKLFFFSRLFKKIVVFLIKQFKKIIVFVFLNIHNLIKILSLYSYKSYLFLKKQIQKILVGVGLKPALILLSRYSIFFVTFIIIFVLVVFDNLKAKEINVSMIGQESIFYHFLNENQEEFIEEIGIPTTFNSSDQFLKSNIQPFIEEQEQKIITQGGTILVKPNISVTVETPQIRTKSIKYIVKAGDVISGIAKKFNISTNTILWENNLSERSLIKPGDELVILPVTGVVHTVGKGENLGKIAKKYNINETEILAINELTNDSLKINQKIIIPGGEKHFPLIFAKKVAINKKWVPPVLGKFISSKIKAGFIWPTSSYRITQYYHWGHPGIDIGGKNHSSPIYASADGVVASAIYSNRGYGRHIIINNGNNTTTLYGHMSEFYVKRGERVEKGQVIGLLGSTGRSTGPHLHFEIKINGQKINPLKYIR
ncbi:hypothetical protein CVV26_02070 [Candidatus Kuenenbacteria bacterium HGW-Kuenenbacteria-1]|uniref:LysM domain-containing protein n=1 Tax=Candidatus Kuenenbacteria bacterium HGW-Kuenenbacteria-1 TaxID=2013812 RepID=A0A2N1UNC1_9BACT|nr:MAG: hypothetical protein CVV26_02070 [Candidatus Kuenenbacteria bacterium HGW-Kuenenbacteria-1]